MARKGRTASKLGIYHVLLRGVNMLFDSENDYAEFYGILKKYTGEKSFRLLSYVLLKNRVHMVIDTLGEDIGKVLKPVCTSYARYFNRVHGGIGKLFYDRFKSEPIDSQEELKAVVAFVNAVSVRNNAVHTSISDSGRKICDYISNGLSESDFTDTQIVSIFMEDYDCISRSDLDDMIYALSGVMPEDFKKLDKSAQEQAFAAITAKKWLSKTKLYDVLGIKRDASVSKPEKMKKVQKQTVDTEEKKRELSVWLL